MKFKLAVKLEEKLEIKLEGKLEEGPAGGEVGGQVGGEHGIRCEEGDGWKSIPLHIYGENDVPELFEKIYPFCNSDDGDWMMEE